MAIDAYLSEYDRRDWQTVTDGTVRFALIGLGWWTVDLSLPAIADSDLCETTVLVSSSTEKAERIAETHDVDHGISYADYHEGVASDAYEAVYIATPNSYHKEHAEAAARLGKAVLCEKPIEATVDRAREMVSTCDSAGVPFMTAYRLHTDPAARRAREIVHSGGIGKPLFAHGTNSQPLLEMIPDLDQWRLDPERSGYGTSVMDLGIYVINTTRFILGRDPIDASADLQSTHEAFADLDDQWASFRLGFDEGFSLLGSASQHAQSESFLVITGTEGQIRLDPAFHGAAELHVAIRDTTATIEQNGMDAEGEMREEFDYFADRILSGADIYPDGSHGLSDLETIRAIHQAAETGETVTIDR